MGKSIEEVLAGNLSRLMAMHPTLDSNPKIAKAVKVGTGTISRIRNAESSTSIGLTHDLARAFGLQAADLLRPDLFGPNGELQPMPAPTVRHRDIPAPPAGARPLIVRLSTHPLDDESYRTIAKVIGLAEKLQEKK